MTLFGGTSSNLVGGSRAIARNVISGNTGSGVDIAGLGTMGNQVAGNYIGTNAAGTAALGNAQDGVPHQRRRPPATRWGGTVGGGGNVISGNGGDGVEITDAGTKRNLVWENFIGTNAAGTASPWGIPWMAWESLSAASTRWAAPPSPPATSSPAMAATG